MTSASLIYDAGHSKLTLPEGLDGEGGRRVVQDGGTHVHQWQMYIYVWQKPPECCKVVVLPFKLIN